MTTTVKTAWPGEVRSGEVLRELLRRPPILDQPSVCDPLSARFAREAGYEAVTLGGYAVGAHLPLTSELSPYDIEEAARAVIRACGLPLLLDADIGWGGIEEVPGVVARLEAAGVAAVQLASQHVPAQAPFDVPVERQRAHADLLRRVRAARAAREHVLVTARCTVPLTDGYDEALDRAGELLDAGADAVAVNAAGDDVRMFPRDLPGATLIYAGPPESELPGSGQSPFPACVLQQWGYSALSLQYYRCYCVRMRRSQRGADFPALAERKQ